MPSVLPNHRVARVSPILVGVIHQQVDNERHEVVENRRPIPYLIPVHAAPPRRPAVHELVAQRVQTRQDDGEHSGGLVRVAKRPDRLSLCACESPLPTALRDAAILIVPERLKDELVVEQETNRTSKLRPDHLIKQILAIEAHQSVQKLIKYRLLGCTRKR